MIKDLIESKVLAKNWTFTEISNLKSTIETLASNLYSEMKLSERFQLIRDVRVNDSFVGSTFEDAMREAIMSTLQAEVAGIIREMLNDATVKFGGNNNDVPEISVGRESHPERSTDEEKKSSNKK
jgi:hypothetical protein